MWFPTAIELARRTFDFGSSDQSVHEDVALVADGTELINMLRYIDWSEDPVQVEVCNHCGTTGCASGGYVAVRRLGDFVVLAPSPRPYRGDDFFERSQYVTPYWAVRRGAAAAIRIADWQRLYDGGTPLPTADSIRPLSWDEAFLLAQFEAPNEMLGSPGERRQEPLSKTVIATDPWLPNHALDRLADSAEWSTRRGVPQILRSGYETVSVFVEEPFASFDLFARKGSEFGLLLSPGIALFAEGTR